jgi:hypothetical protein
MRLPFRPILTVLAGTLVLAACDDGLSVDGSLNQCSLFNVTRAISVGDTLTGTLTNLNCRIGESRGTGWRFDVDEPTRVQIDLTSEDFNPFLILTDRSVFPPLGYDDDTGEGWNSRMWRNLPTGEYYVWATTVAAGELGDFQISIEEVEGASCDEPVGELALPDTVEGELAPASCLIVTDGTFADPWLLEISEASAVQASLLSADFNAFLVVTDMEDEWIAWDNDSGDGTNARLTVELEPGTYKVWANTFSSGEMGSYELRVQLDGGEATQQGARLTAVSRPD